MLRRIGLSGIVGLLLAAAPAFVDDAFRIKLKKAGKGDVTRMKVVNIDDLYAKVEADGGVRDEEKEPSEVATEEFKETILEMEKDKSPSKIRREYSKATVKKGEKEITLPYEGKTLLIEKKDGKYHFTIEGGEELKGVDAKSLERRFNSMAGVDVSDLDGADLEEMLMPKNRVRVNETWKFDPGALVKACVEKPSEQRMSVDKSKMAAQSKLVRAYKKDGRQYGVIDITIVLPLKGELPAVPGTYPLQEGSKITLHTRYDGCIDGTSSDSVIERSASTVIVFTRSGVGEGNIKARYHLTQKGKRRTTDLSKK